ncbi:hypothetical protein BBAL3_2687 [Brevundimonas sp. BAL3]|nr:hypothetical protein BBAL3_2687 [Brevundimonas sp. BAL3]
MRRDHESVVRALPPRHARCAPFDPPLASAQRGRGAAVNVGVFYVAR